MVTSPRQLLAAGLHCGTVRGVVSLLVTLAAEPPVGIGVGKIGHAILPHALRELAHLSDIGWVPGVLMFAAWSQVAACLLGGTERWIILVELVVTERKAPVGVGIGEVRHAVVPHALRVRDARILAIRTVVPSTRSQRQRK